MAPLLASMELEYKPEYDDQGGTYMSLSTITLTTLSGESWVFGSYDDPFEAAEHTGTREAFADRVVVETGIAFDADDEAHQAAFSLWMGSEFGAHDWPALWGAIWSWAESDRSVQSVTFREEDRPVAGTV